MIISRRTSTLTATSWKSPRKPQRQLASATYSMCPCLPAALTGRASGTTLAFPRDLNLLGRQIFGHDALRVSMTTEGSCRLGTVGTGSAI